MRLDTPAPPADPDAAPTKVRYGVLAYLCSLVFVLYIDRVCISIAAPEMKADLHISNTAMGYVLSAFTLAYGLFEIPTGRWGDRYGSRGVLTRIVLWWSAFTVLTGCVAKFTLDTGYRLTLPVFDIEVPLLVNSYIALLAVRFLFGAGEAGALPNTARVLARWFPPDRRGPAQGLINTFMLIGAAATPSVATRVMLWLSWRWTFVFFGLIGAVWAVAFYVGYRDDPAEHPGVNEAERRLIARGRGPAAHADRHSPVPWWDVLANPNVWLLGSVVTCTAFNSYLYYTWYPTYLRSAREVSAERASGLATIVLIAGAIGATSGGFLIDWLVRRTGNRRWSRRSVGCGCLALASVLLLSSAQCDSPEASALLTAATFFCANATMASWWSAVTELAGSHPGAIFGLMNSLGVPGAFVSPIFVGTFVDVMEQRGFSGREQWDPVFYVFAAAMGIGSVLWLFVDTSRQLPESPSTMAAEVLPPAQDPSSCDA